MTAFEEVSYAAQVARMRNLARQALLRWPIDVASCHFLSHGENTTFRITTKRGRKVLLRIHRREYHTRAGIIEELQWLDRLSTSTTLSVPRPFRSRQGLLLESIVTPETGKPRQCCLFEWIEGRFVRKSARPSQMAQIGQLAGKLQKASRGVAIAERWYWDAEGLVGTKAKFGRVDRLPDTSRMNQKIIDEGRRLIFRKLKDFQKVFPHKQGLIHADLHFGNVLFSKGGVSAIDFDDCGLGFHAYDLAVPLIAVARMFRDGRTRELPRMKDALIEGYASQVGWDKHDEAILPYLVSARKLAMLGWLQSRSDNPMLKKYLSNAVVSVAKHLRKEYDL